VVLAKKSTENGLLHEENNGLDGLGLKQVEKIGDTMVLPEISRA
jgi:hypothetical protein